MEGVRVVDLTTFLAAPTAARVLGEWGADVIKVEAPNGDPGRTQGAVFGMTYEDDENLGFDMSNMNKRFVTLNLKTPDGMEVMHRLLADADVFVTNIRTKSLVKMGLDYDSLKEKYPRLVFAHCLGYGENGPEKDTAGFDVTCYMARGGVFGTTVNKGDAPMIPTNGFGDFQVSMCLASGISAALFNRERTGRGDKISVSLHHAAVYMLNGCRLCPVRQRIPEIPHDRRVPDEQRLPHEGRKVGCSVRSAVRPGLQQGHDPHRPVRPRRQP
jgi:crotonobetainyl-CoA:carnitine CoA-transferase CaiB-like acyl-CoA transferase